MKWKTIPLLPSLTGDIILHKFRLPVYPKLEGIEP